MAGALPAGAQALTDGFKLYIRGSRAAQVRALAWFVATSATLGSFAALSPSAPIPLWVRITGVVLAVGLGSVVAVMSASHGPSPYAIELHFTAGGKVLATERRCLRVSHSTGVPARDVVLVAERRGEGAERPMVVWKQGRAVGELNAAEFLALIELGVVPAGRPRLKRSPRSFQVLLWGSVSAAVITSVAAPVYQRLAPEDRPADVEHLSGSFRFANSTGNPWSAAPVRCLSGRERGFQGIVFEFAEGNLVREIRIDTQRSGDNRMHIGYAEPSRPVEIITEAECDGLSGRIRRDVISVNGRDMDALAGDVVVDCPARGWTGRASFEGCLPDP